MRPALRRRAPGAAAPVLVVAALLTSGVWVGRVVTPAAKSDATGTAEPASRSGPARALALRAAERPPEPAEPDDRVAPGPIPEDRYRCRTPEVEIDRSYGCELGLPYPSCRWTLPPPGRANRSYRIWRNTVEEHLEGRPALVSVVLATAEEYARRYPGEVVDIGDLDAPGPRHETHDVGVDVDLYLPGVMEVENLGNDEYAENYERLSALERRMLQERVQTLARILAACTGGRLRIYYNDDEVRRRFHQWFDAQGYVSPFGRPMQKHNDLHRFHFHVTVPKEMEPLAPEGPST